MIYSFNWAELGDIVQKYGVLIVSATALFVVVGGEWLKSKFFKSELKVIGFEDFRQNHELIVWRIIISNIGSVTAEDVQVDVIKIKDDGKIRDNFLPLPLRWTHLDKENRNILINQSVYLDIFEHIDKGLSSNAQHYVKLGSRYAQEIKDFCFLEPGKSEVTLRLFQKNGKFKEIKLFTDWDGNYVFAARLKGEKWKLEGIKKK